jgi:MFS family permease
MLGIVRSRGVRRIVRRLRPAQIEPALAPRDDLVKERLVAPGIFEEEAGPLESYRRTVNVGEFGGAPTETIEYRLRLPYFRWLFGPLVRWTLRRRPDRAPGHQPWWAPRDRLDPRQVMMLGLLAAASMCSAYTNTLFTQTVHRATKDFGVGQTGQGIAGGIVRAGIFIAWPFAFRADRTGRRQVLTLLAFLAPTVCALGAFAPNFASLVATQTVGRPLGLALDVLIAVVAAEEVPRNSRAYAVSVLALASGFGAGLCVLMLNVTDTADWAWRIPYVASFLWLIVAVSVRRRLPETRRFAAEHAHHPRLATPRLSTLATIAFFGNIFVAPASFFQNRYLEEVRLFGDSRISLFTLSTSTPAGLGLLVGGWLADSYGRRVVGAISLLIGTALVASSFNVGGAGMWGAASAGGIVLGITVPALLVYRTELFPTANRGRAGAFVTTSALLGGIIGLIVTGVVVEHSNNYGRVLGILACGQLVVAFLVLRRLPESAHRELEDLNPEDAVPS